MPNDKTTIEQTPEEKLLKKLRGDFLLAVKMDEKRREEQDEADRFYDGDQWTEEEKQVLEERKQPVVVINRIKPKIDAMVGMELKLPVDTRAFRRGTAAPEPAEHITECFRYIEYRSNFDKEESGVFKDIAVGGRGWYKTDVEWDGLDPEVFTRRADDENIFLDPYSKRDDLSDAKYLCETVWMDLEDAKHLFETKTKELDDALIDQLQSEKLLDSAHGKEYKPDQYREPGQDMSPEELSIFVDAKRKRVRVVSHYYREPYRKRFLFGGEIPDGFIDISNDTPDAVKRAKNLYPKANEHTEVGFKLNVCTFVWNAILEEKYDVKPWDDKATFDHVKVGGYKKRNKKEKGREYGIVKQHLDPQREVNKRRSKMLHLLNVDKMVFEDGAFDSPEEARKEWVKPDAMLKVNPQFKWERISNQELATSQFQLLQEAKAEIEGAGVHSEIEGMSPATSGRDFKLRHEAATQNLSEMFDNLRQARKRVAQIWLEKIQRYWTMEKVIKVTDDPEAPAVILNQKDANGNIVNSVAGKYDIIIEEAPESLNLQSEDFDKLVKLATLGVPIPPQIIIESSDLSSTEKRQIYDQIQQQQAQQAQILAAQQAAVGMGAQGNGQGMPPGMMRG